MKFKSTDDSIFKDSEDMIWKDADEPAGPGIGVVIDPVVESLAVRFDIQSLAVQYRVERA
jgi:hypothetical protein